MPEGRRRIYAEDIARERGISLRQAQRRLLELEASHGASVVGLDGNRRYTTVAAQLRIRPADEGEVTNVMIASRLDRMITLLKAIADEVGCDVRFDGEPA